MFAVPKQCARNTEVSNEESVPSVNCMKVIAAVCILKSQRRRRRREGTCAGWHGKGGTPQYRYALQKEVTKTSESGCSWHLQCAIYMSQGSQEKRLKPASVKMQVCCFNGTYLRAFANTGVLVGDHACGSASGHLQQELGLRRASLPLGFINGHSSAVSNTELGDIGENPSDKLGRCGAAALLSEFCRGMSAQERERPSHRGCCHCPRRAVSRQLSWE